jgi:hypothetical protein
VTADEAIAVHAAVQELLSRQAELLSRDDPALDEAGGLSGQVTARLASLPTADRLTGLDDATRTRLSAIAIATAAQLEEVRTALQQRHGQRLAQHLRAERDGAALRQYLPAAGSEPPRYLDERR